MTLRFLIFFLLTALTLQTYSQTDLGIRRKKLHPTFFDTTKENTFIYEVPNAILYFKQDDIKKFIDNPTNKNILANYGHKLFLDTLSKKTKLIKVTDFYFYYDVAQRDSIFRQHQENLVTKKLSEEFYFLGAELILKGQFMVYSKSDKRFVTKKLIAKRRKELLGQRTLYFYLPDKKKFYYVIITLGE